MYIHVCTLLSDQGQQHIGNIKAPRVVGGGRGGGAAGAGESGPSTGLSADLI